MGSSLAFTMFLYGILAPALSGAGLAATARRSAALQALLMNAAALSGLLLVYGPQFQWPPVQALDWLVLLLPVLAIPALLPLPPAARWALAAGSLLGAAFLMLQPALAALPNAWLLTVLIAILWSAYLLPLPAADASGGTAGALLATSGALAVLVGLSGSALVAQLLGATAANLAGVGLVSVATGRSLPLSAFRAILFGLSMIALFYAQIHYLLFILPLLAGLTSAPLALRFMKKNGSRLKAEFFSFGIALLIAAPSLIFAIQKKLSQPNSYY